MTNYAGFVFALCNAAFAMMATIAWLLARLRIEIRSIGAALSILVMVIWLLIAAYQFDK